jgi:hypothetical protein
MAQQLLSQGQMAPFLPRSVFYVVHVAVFVHVAVGKTAGAVETHRGGSGGRVRLVRSSI